MIIGPVFLESKKTLNNSRSGQRTPRSSGSRRRLRFYPVHINNRSGVGTPRNGGGGRGPEISRDCSHNTCNCHGGHGGSCRLATRSLVDMIGWTLRSELAVFFVTHFQSKDLGREAGGGWGVGGGENWSRGNAIPPPPPPSASPSSSPTCSYP